MTFFTRCLATVVTTVFASSVLAYDYSQDFNPNNAASWPTITIIIDDIGNRYGDGKRAINLPGPVAYAVLPHMPYSEDLAQRAHESGKEVMLHLPLEATKDNHLLGAGAITLDDSSSVFTATLQKNLAAIPHVSGVNNHMGSLLTRHPGHMRWLMEVLEEQENLFFVDSYTTVQSVAYEIAQEHQIPTIKRDVFLDSEQTVSAVSYQFARLKNIARKKGYAVAIGHPFPETLAVLEQELPRLTELGYRLISVESMIGYQQLLRAGTKQELRLSISDRDKTNIRNTTDEKIE